MPKPRSGYKRPYSYEPPPGVKINVREPTHKNLKTAARANHCTIGQYCETKLLQYLRLRMTVPAPKRDGPQPARKTYSFQISEGLFDDIERFVAASAPQGADPDVIAKLAKRWIASTMLHCLAIELERLRGVEEQPDRFA